MIKQAHFDIFRVEPAGVLWMDSATTFEDAQARIQQLGARQHGDFVVLNHLSGEKTVFNIGSTSAAQTR